MAVQDFVGASPVSGDDFRNVIGHFTSGVTVITTESEGVQYGSTASAVSSLSTEPPMVLICLNESSSTRAAIAESQAFAVNILAEEQDDLAMRFASKNPDKFDPAQVAVDTDAATGQPYLSDSLAVITAKVVETVRGGTHSVFLGLVQTAKSREGTPLAYYRGQFGRLELTAAEDVRDQVLARIMDGRLTPGAKIDTNSLQEELGARGAIVQVALGLLYADGFVEEAEDGFAPPRITVESIIDSIRARATIELGAIDRIVDGGRPEDLELLRTRLSEWVPASSSPQWDQRHDHGMTFHETLVSLAGSAALVTSYRQLSIPSVLARAFRGYALSDADESYGDDHATLVDALERGDRDGAKSIVNRHSERVIAGAVDVIMAG